MTVYILYDHTMSKNSFNNIVRNFHQIVKISKYYFKTDLGPNDHRACLYKTCIIVIFRASPLTIHYYKLGVIVENKQGHLKRTEGCTFPTVSTGSYSLFGQKLCFWYISIGLYCTAGLFKSYFAIGHGYLGGGWGEYSLKL